MSSDVSSNSADNSATDGAQRPPAKLVTHKSTSSSSDQRTSQASLTFRAAWTCWPTWTLGVSGSPLHSAMLRRTAAVVCIALTLMLLLAGGRVPTAILLLTSVIILLMGIIAILLL